MSRLSIEISAQQHQQIKARAAAHGLSLKDYIVEKAIGSATKEEKAAMDALMALLAPRIKSARKGKVSALSMDKVIQKAKAQRRG